MLKLLWPLLMLNLRILGLISCLWTANFVQNNATIILPGDSDRRASDPYLATKVKAWPETNCFIFSLFTDWNGFCNYTYHSKWFEPRRISSSYCVIVRVSVVLKGTVVGDRRFDNLSGSHLQSQVKVFVSRCCYISLVSWKRLVS